MNRFNTLIIMMLLGISAASAQGTTLWNGGHEDAPWGFDINLVTKDWRTNVGERIIHENLWGEANKRMYGVLVGFLYQPCFKFGVGARTGFYTGGYSSYSDAVKDYGADRFDEFVFYAPFHLMYRFPITRKMSFSAYGGVGVEWAVYGSYVKEDHRVASAVLSALLDENVNFDRNLQYQAYGRGEWPRHWNLQWEVGGCFRYDYFQIGFTYSFGATNHHFYPGYLARQDRISISIGLVGKKGGK